MLTEVTAICGGGLIIAAIIHSILKRIEKPRCDLTLTSKANDLLIALEELKEVWDSTDHSQIERAMIRAELTASYLKRWLEIGK